MLNDYVHEDPVKALVRLFNTDQLHRDEDHAIAELGYIIDGGYPKSLNQLVVDHAVAIKQYADTGVELNLVEVDAEKGYVFTEFGRKFFHELVGTPVN